MVSKHVYAWPFQPTTKHHCPLKVNHSRPINVSLSTCRSTGTRAKIISANLTPQNRVRIRLSGHLVVKPLRVGTTKSRKGVKYDPPVFSLAFFSCVHVRLFPVKSNPFYERQNPFKHLAIEFIALRKFSRIVPVVCAWNLTFSLESTSFFFFSFLESNEKQCFVFGVFERLNISFYLGTYYVLEYLSNRCLQGRYVYILHYLISFVICHPLLEHGRTRVLEAI